MKVEGGRQPTSIERINSCHNHYSTFFVKNIPSTICLHSTSSDTGALSGDHPRGALNPTGNPFEYEVSTKPDDSTIDAAGKLSMI